MKKSVLIISIIMLSSVLKSQIRQFFDGADTTQWSIEYTIEPGATWQVGPPQKIIFDSAASIPNVLVTDTVSTYRSNDTSIVTFKISPDLFYWGVQAVRWMQKLDMDSSTDGGLVHFKYASDTSWSDVFDNPYVYNFYGFDKRNTSLLNGLDSSFTGTDSTWSDIWLCFDYSYGAMDTFYLRFTFISDSIDNQKDGWMIDNIFAQETIIHTIKEAESDAYLMVYPSPTEGRVNIRAEKLDQYHIIEHMELLSSTGQIVRKYKRAPTKFYIDISDLPDALYYLKITTNIKTETLPVMLKRK